MSENSVKLRNIRIVSFVLAGFLILGGFILKERAETNKYRLQASHNYQHAFLELVASVTELQNALEKSLYLTSPGMLSATCADAFAKAETAQTALGVLPFSDTELGHTAAFISRAGDYAYVISKKTASGGALTEDERSNLTKLSECASVLSENLINLFADVQAGRISIERSEALLGSTDGELLPSSLADSFFSMESEFPEVPTLIYDGPFSAHITGREPVSLENSADIPVSEALTRVSEFTGFDENRFVLRYTREGELPAYVFSTRLYSGDMLIEVSRQGGAVISVSCPRDVSERNLTPQEAVGAASRFLSSHGYGSMTASYHQTEDNRTTVNFAYTQDSVICYPDLIKVTVALDSGSVVGFESHGYIMNHTERELSEPAVSADEASSKLSPELTVLSSGLAVIPTSGQYEVLCHEFKCENPSGEHYILYVNAETGVEEKLLILLEDESGTLTI